MNMLTSGWKPSGAVADAGRHLDALNLLIQEDHHSQSMPFRAQTRVPWNSLNDVEVTAMCMMSNGVFEQDEESLHDSNPLVDYRASCLSTPTSAWDQVQTTVSQLFHQSSSCSSQTCEVVCARFHVRILRIVVR